MRVVVAAFVAGCVIVLSLVLAQRVNAEPRPDACHDYWNLEAGKAEPVRQHRFNYLTPAEYARWRGACMYGMDGAEYQCLYSKINEESGWYELADGPNGPAGNTWGIPQAYPGEKMRSFGDDWRTNGRVQVRWMLQYIEDRYGSLWNDSDPCSAGY